MPPVSLDLSSAPVAVLPMRLNVDALNDLVILEEGSDEPTVALSAAAMTFTVTNTGDNGGVNPPPGAGTGTLRQAIVDANANPGADMITFNILPAGMKTISPMSALPTITDPVTIDGTAQPGFAGMPIIELNGTGAGGGTSGFTITAGSSTVRGLVINRFNGNGINLGTNGGNRIEGNFIGTNAAGTAALGNSFHGVAIESAPNTVGGTAAGARNVISGNTGNGVVLIGGGATMNQVQGNFIGTDAIGTAALGNSLDGVLINGAPSNTIGGTASGAGNTIAFNSGAGVFVNSGTGNAIDPNSIHDNTGLGIDLSPAGVTPNDPGDPDTGPNNLQNFPVLATASSSGGTTTITGTLNSTPNRTFVLNFFANVACDPSGNGEGQTFLDSAAVGPTDGSGNVIFTVTLPVSVGMGQNITSTARDSITNDTSEFSACQAVVVPSADLALAKTDSPDPVLAGNNLTYTVTVTNNGPSTASSVVLTDSVPPNTTFVSNSGAPGWSCTNPPVGSGSTISCTIGSLAPGAMATFTIVVKVDPTAPNGSMITNTATVSSSTPDPNAANNSATATTTVNTQADLSVSKTDSPDPVPAGNNITYMVTVTNNGPSAAGNVMLTDSIPANTTFVSDSGAPGWSCSNPAVGGMGTISCTIPSLPFGASSTFTIVVKVGSGTTNGTTITNTATVSSTTADPSPGNNSATATTTVGTGADLSVSKTASPSPVLAGNNITYTVMVTNNGPSTANGVTLSDTTPTNTTFVSDSGAAGWSCTNPPVGGAGTISCTIASLGSGATATFTIVVKVDPSTANGTMISNTATVSSSTSDPTSGNNSATATTTVNTQADLSVSKTDSPDPVLAGNNLTHTLPVTNSGPSAAGSVALTDTVPANTTFVSNSGVVGWSCANPPIGGTGAISCTIGSLQPGAAAAFTIMVKVDPATASGSTITNTAMVSSSGTTDPNPGNNSATATTTVSTAADLSLNKTSSPNPVQILTNLTYTMNVTNNGPSVATGVTLTDTLPPDVVFVSWQPTQGTCTRSGSVVTCVLGTLNPGAAAMVTIVVRPPLPGTITNTATVVGNQSDPIPANNTATATTTVQLGPAATPRNE